MTYTVSALGYFSSITCGLGLTSSQELGYFCYPCAMVHQSVLQADRCHRLQGV